MYVAMPFFVFMVAMVRWLINGENISYVLNPCCLLHCSVLWARVTMGYVCPCFVRNPMLPLCFICFSLCFAIQLINCIDVFASCIIFCEAMCLLKNRDSASMTSHVHNGIHSSRLHGISIDSWSRDAISSSIIAYLIPRLHLHFYLSTPLPDFVIICSLSMTFMY